MSDDGWEHRVVITMITTLAVTIMAAPTSGDAYTSHPDWLRIVVAALGLISGVYQLTRNYRYLAIHSSTAVIASTLWLAAVVLLETMRFHVGAVQSFVAIAAVVVVGACVLLVIHAGSFRRRQAAEETL